MSVGAGGASPIHAHTQVTQPRAALLSQSVPSLVPRQTHVGRHLPLTPQPARPLAQNLQLSGAARDPKGQQTGEGEQDMSRPPAGGPTSKLMS